MLLVVMLVSGVLMGMSGTEDTGLKLSVKKVSKADEGREIYTGQESVSLVLAWNEHAEGTAASDVQWIMCRGRDHLGYQKEEKRQIEGRGTMTYVPDLSVFADGEVTFSFWAGRSGRQYGRRSADRTDERQHMSGDYRAIGYERAESGRFLFGQLSGIHLCTG